MVDQFRASGLTQSHLLELTAVRSDLVRPSRSRTGACPLSLRVHQVGQVSLFDKSAMDCLLRSLAPNIGIVASCNDYIFGI